MLLDKQHATLLSPIPCIHCVAISGKTSAQRALRSQARATLRKQESNRSRPCIRAEVHPDLEIRKTSDYFQQKDPELRSLSTAPLKKIRTITQISRLEKLKLS
jgi:hypothetical protein